MTRPTPSTIKRLFAVSGNQCAFPGCTAPLVIDNVVTAEICHIRAQSSNGPRYRHEQSDEDRHGFDNLILMCGDHHKVIDADEEEYTVEKLIGMKAKHEAKHAGGSEPSDDVARQFLVRVVHEFATPLTFLPQEADEAGVGTVFNVNVSGGEVGEIINIDELKGGLTINKNK